MARRIIPARFPAGDAPDVQELLYANGQTFQLGAVLTLSSGQLIEATSPITGATLHSIAMQGVDTNPGYQAANNPTVSIGREQKVSVARLNRMTVFMGTLVNNSAVPVAAATTDIGVNYGLRPFSGIWYVDRSQTAANACVQVVGIDAVNPFIVFFKPIEARLLTP